jgi:hypothetical protein
MKTGIISSWNKEKFVGTILDRSTNPPGRYFLFGSRIMSGPEPYPGALVKFEVDERPPLPGKLPVATHAEILDGAQ